MPKIITFIAAPRTEPPVPDIATQADKASLAAVRMALEDIAKTSNGALVVIPVASLGQMRKRLTDDPPQPGDHIQIVGHAMAGMLALGSFFDGLPSDKSGAYLLDSNLFMHYVLGDTVPPTVTIGVVGCSVAADRAASDYADGPTLLFDLTRLFGCPVSGTVDPVGPDDFAPTGRYRFLDRMVTASGRAVSPALPPKAIPTDPNVEALPQIVEVLRMPLLGSYESIADKQQALAGFQQLGPLMVRRCPSVSTGLALPEIVVRLADETLATFLLGGRVIRGERGRDVTFFAPTNSAELQMSLRRAFKQVI